MSGIKIAAAFGLGLVVAGAPVAASAHKMKHSKHMMSPMGSKTKGAPDGANTGGKQSPTGGNPGQANHS